jgi:ParB family chromosome partitioning protein
MRLLGVSDETVIEALAIVMAETLEAGTPLIETLGAHLRIDMADAYSVDGALLDLIKDREVLDAIVAEVAGEQVAQANAKATGKVKRQIVADCLAGANRRTKVERFVPRWMAFPPRAYTQRGGVAAVSRAAAIEGLFAPIAETDAPTDDADAAVDGQGEGEASVASEPVAQAA